MIKSCMKDIEILQVKNIYQISIIKCLNIVDFNLAICYYV